MFIYAGYEDGVCFDNVKLATEYVSHYQPEDISLNSRDIEIFNDGTVVLNNDLTYMTPAAWRQLVRLTGNDVKISRIDESELAVTIKETNEWLNNSSKDLLFRMSGGIATAVLSEVYCPVSNLDILNSLAEVGVEKCRISIRNGWLWASVINEQVTFQPQVGDITHGGWDINHNDRGQGALHIAHFLYRLICSNGAVVTEHGASNFTHRVAEKDLLTGAIRDRVGILTKHSNRISIALTTMANIDLGNKRTLKLQNIARNLLGKSKYEEFKSHITSNKSCYEAYNYITRLAQDYKMDTRRGLEVLGGNLVAEFIR